jgi:PKD repeat protein
VTTTGTGTSTTITGLSAGTYTFTVSNASDCISAATANVVINAQPAIPTAQFSYTTNGLTVTFTNTSTGASSYSWNIGGYVTSDANPEYSFPSNGQYTVVLTANNQGCTSTYSQTITLSEVGIETADLNNQVIIYPNPTNGIVTISLNDQPNTGMLSVFDMMGRVVFQREINEKKVTMDLTPLSPGIYEFQFNLDRKIIHQRIVIQNIK